MDISLELYKVFLEVAKASSFSKAAEALFVSQSAVSQSIKMLEKKLGFPLFIRTTKKVSMTSEAEILYKHLERAFAIIKGAEEQILQSRDPFRGELVFAATDTLCKYYLIPEIKKVQEWLPKLKIKIVNGTSLECFGLLEKAKADFAVINLPADIDENKFKVERVSSFATFLPPATH